MLSKSTASAFIAEFAPRVEAPAVAVPTDLRGEALAVWNERDERSDRSKRDARFVLACLRIGIDESRARVLLLALPHGKARTDGRVDDSYWKSTIEWVRRIWDADCAALRLVRTARRSRATDPDVIAALARVHGLSAAKYHKAVKRLAGGHIPKSEILKAARAALAEVKVAECDEFARHAVSDGASAGWWYRGDKGWISYTSSDWARNLSGRGVPPATLARALADKPWTLVAEPFQAEDLDGRRWNMKAARLRYAPQVGPHPMWDQLLRVVGRGLDALWPDGGANYLLLWIASMIQRPAVKLPYLFLYGEEQDSGKSSLHEGLALLLDRGYVLANEALTNERGFNGELHGAVLCAADEIKVGKRAYARIKNWVTGDRIQIHPKGKTAYQLDNRTHWIQTGQRADDCPQMRGDTRITAFQVWRADAMDQIAKDEMFRRFAAEGPMFTHTLTTIALPPVVGRLGLPVLETAEKRSQQMANSSCLEEFLDTNDPQHLAWTDTELSSRFIESLSGPDRGEWTPARVTLEMPSGHGRRRRLMAWLHESATSRPTRVTLDEILSALPGDWKSPDALGHALRKPWPGFAITPVRSHGRRHVKIEKC